MTPIWSSVLRRKQFVPAVVGLAACACVILSTSLLLKRNLLRFEEFQSVQILDRDGSVLRTQLSSRQGTSLWTDLSDISPHLIDATLAAEDKRFYHHPGIDVVAIARAFAQNLRHGRVISGGSTLTQQLVRTIRNYPRDWPHKILEASQSVLLELTTSKKTILINFLNRAPYGSQCYGVGAAARIYFKKPPAHLSLAESAFLAGLPQSPTRFNPYTHFDKARERQRAVLAQMLEQGAISPEEYILARQQPLSLVPKEQLFYAPHFCDWVLNQLPVQTNLRAIRTTLDLALQQDMEALVATYVKRLKNEQVTNAAVVVLDNRSNEILSMVGSANYFDDAIDGQVNGALAPRPPGSTWKPFTYGLALEQGMPASRIIPDLPLHASSEAGDFAPHNYDESFHGPVRLRTALACSYNIPAVRVLEQVGPETLLVRLQNLGFAFLDKPASYYGLGLTLGGAEASLLQLTQAYATLAHSGSYQPARMILAPTQPAPVAQSVFSPAIAYLLTDILSDNDARSAAFGTNSALNLPFPCAIKTGTSKNYRDSLTLGYTTDYTVGVWVGNFNGKPMKRVAGSTGAALFFRDIMFRLHRDHYPENFKQPGQLISVAICPRSGLKPSDSCPATIRELFLPDTQPTQTCDVHQKIPIDIRNGLLATPDCAESAVRTEIFEIYDPIYRVWMDEHNIPQAPTRFSPLCESETQSVPNSVTTPFATTRANTFEIAFPGNGDVFVIDPILRREFQTLLLKPTIGNGIDSIEWLVDGKSMKSVNAPFTVRWTLAPGEHRFQIRAKIGEILKESLPVTIRVF